MKNAKPRATDIHSMDTCLVYPEMLSGIKSSNKGTIAIAFVHEALACLPKHSDEVRRLLASVGIAHELLHSNQARVTSAQFGLLWHGITKIIGDEFFGLDSHRMKPGSFTILCHSIIHAENLERGLKRALRFLNLIIDDLYGELIINGETISIEVRDESSTNQAASISPKRAFTYGTYLLIVHGLACWLIGRRIPLIQAHFRCEEPSYSDEWRTLFCPDLHFSKNSSGFQFSSKFISMQNVQNEKSMKKFLRDAPANFLVKYKNSDSITAKIRRHLRNLPSCTWPDFPMLAKQMNFSAATLRRRLDGEGVTYRVILDDLRRDMAIRLLSDDEMDIVAVADAVGFSETSAFSRAFKKWTGVAPGKYRTDKHDKQFL